MTEMTIKAVRLTRLQVPWPQDPWLKGHAFGDTRNILVAEVETAGGVVGMGYLHVFRPIYGHDQGLPGGNRRSAPSLARTPSAVEAIWHDLWTYTVTFGRGGIATMAQSLIDIALWDALGKRAGLPLHRLWLLCAQRIAGLWQRLLPRLRRRRHGRQGAALQEPGLQGDQDAGRAYAGLARPTSTMCARMAPKAAVGPDIEIMIDVNMGWTADVAIQMGRKFEEYDVYWLEEPVPPRRLRRLQADRARARSQDRGRRDPFHALRSHAVLRGSGAADPAAGSHARRLHRPAQDRRAR